MREPWEFKYVMRSPAILRHFFSTLICITVSVAPIRAQTDVSGEVNLTRCWAHGTAASGMSRLAFDGTRIFLSAPGAKIESLSSDGKKLWSTELGGDITSNLLPMENALFLSTAPSLGESGKRQASVLRALSKETGITSWTIQLTDADEHYIGSFSGNLIVVSGNGVVQSLEPRTGAVVWRREVSDRFVAEPAFNSTKVVIPASGRQIFAISLATGQIDSLQKVSFDVTAVAETHTGELIAGDDRGNISSMLSGGGKANWKFKTGGQISTVFPVGENIMAASHDNFVYLLVSRNGGVVWKRRLPGRMTQIGAIANKYALMTSIEEHSAVLVDLTSGKAATSIFLGPEERIVHDPVGANGTLYLLTNEAVYSYSLRACPLNTEGGPDKVPVTASPKTILAANR
ncbi:MAG: PQQ-binding-like beta-propeller repeat protein [Pyrinomonadaceae bacterium]